MVSLYECVIFGHFISVKLACELEIPLYSLGQGLDQITFFSLLVPFSSKIYDSVTLSRVAPSERLI